MSERNPTETTRPGARLPMTREEIRELETAIGPAEPFGRHLAVCLDETLRRLDPNSERLISWTEAEELRNRTLSDELQAAGKASEGAFKWAVDAVRTMGFDEAADRATEAKNWVQRLPLYINETETMNQAGEEFNPTVEAYLAIFMISGKMKDLDNNNHHLSLQRRLQNLAEEIARAGYALGWARQMKGKDHDMTGEVKGMLQQAGITG